MSMFDDVLNGLENGHQGGLLQKVGGIQGLQALLAEHGLGQQVSSWIGTGCNQPVYGNQLGSALQSGGLGSLLQEAAQKMDISQDELHEKLAQMLPQVVDHATLDGTHPANDGSGFDLASLEGLAGKWFG